MKRRVRPIHRLRRISVFHRVVVDVVDMMPEIIVAFDPMFPVTALPNAAFASRNPNHRTSFGFRQTQAEIRFDTTPASREIGIARRQPPDPMHMIRQYHPRNDREWTARSFECDTSPQPTEFRDQQIVATPLQQIHREKPRPARRPFASIIRHARQHARIATNPASENNPSARQKIPKNTKPSVGRNPRSGFRHYDISVDSRFNRIGYRKTVESAVRVPPYGKRGLCLTAFAVFLSFRNQFSPGKLQYFSQQRPHLGKQSEPLSLDQKAKWHNFLKNFHQSQIDPQHYRADTFDTRTLNFDRQSH